MSLQEKAKLVIKPHNLSFNASRGWVRTFFNRHKLALRARTSISQKLPKQLDGVLSKFFEDATRFMRIGKYPLSLGGNADETPAFFNMLPSNVLGKKVRGSVWFVPQREKKNIWGLFCQPQQTDEYSSTHHHFHRKNWENYLGFKHPSWNTKEGLNV